MKAFLVGLSKKLQAIINGFMDAIVKSVSDLKRFFVMVTLSFCVLDIVLLGKIGIVSFLLDKLKEIISILTTGGWPLVVIVLLIIIFKDKKPV